MYTQAPTAVRLAEAVPVKMSFQLATISIKHVCIEVAQNQLRTNNCRAERQK